MSYRAMKHLLGETSLERKCRWLLGGAVLTLMSISFYVSSWQTKGIAYDQLNHTGSVLVQPILARLHVRGDLAAGLEEYRIQSETNSLNNFKNYREALIIPGVQTPERLPSADDLDVLMQFTTEAGMTSAEKRVPEKRSYIYYGAVRATQSCINCHQFPDKMAQLTGSTREAMLESGKANEKLQVGELMALVRITLSTELIDSSVNQNYALLITFAVASTILILLGSYAVIRYVIVRPVKHLKDVADAIAAGQLNVRSEIHTSDEFEDLSDAFNRMLRNVTAFQQKNRTLIDELAGKVDELARLNMALYESNRLKSDFLSTMSHELRTPLNSIIGFSEHLVNADNLTEKQGRWSSNIMTSGQQLLTLINDILELTKLEAGKMKVRSQAIQPRELCQQALNLCRQQAEKKSLELQMDVEENIEVRQDVGKLNQILSNLLSNAIKFTPEGGIVKLSARVSGADFILSVMDTGVGIAAEEQEMIFDKFRQTSNPLTREQGGTGLGLSIVRELAKLLGGDISLKSDLGRGSTFTVRVAARLKSDFTTELEAEPNA
jgi:two-component system, NarL family, sensor histidine kinase BarA